jgi:hypothetical protein
MRVKIEHDGTFLPNEVQRESVSLITEALKGITTIDGKLIINDTLCFRKQRRGGVTNCVMNSASYLSGKFQKNLAEFDGCSGETKIDGQNIDGLIELDIDSVGYKIKDKDDILKVIRRFMEENQLDESVIYTLFPMFYGMYARNGLYDISGLPTDVHNLFEPVPGNKKFRLGVEFETGNVASSFRALNKLFVLFQKGHIDAGVFVTSIDKSSSACRIWPVSNRNGSFQELRQRHYMEQVSLPLVCIGFAPDGFDADAPYLGKNGDLFYLTPTNQQDESNQYNIFVGEDGEEILKPIGM